MNGARGRDECRMKLQIVNLQVAGSNPVGSSSSWTRSSADRAGCFTTPRRRGRIMGIAVANAGRNYSRHRWMVWQVRLLLGIRSLARAGPSGFVHPRRRCKLLPCRNELPRRMPEDYRDRAARRIFGGQVGCSNHPALPKGARSSVNCPATSRRRDDEESPGRMPPVTTGAASRHDHGMRAAR